MKNKIAIITDTASDLTVEHCQELGIYMVPFTVYITKDDENLEFKDKYELDTKTFLQYMRDGYSVQTATAKMGDVVSVYEQVERDGFDTAIVISTSTGLSSMHQNFNIAKDLHAGTLDIHIIDSLTLSHLEGAYVQKAYDLAQAGWEVQAILDAIEELKVNSVIYFVPETLEYLIRGGRIGGISAFIGTLLHIIPVGFVDWQGKFAEYSKNRGLKRAMRSLNKAVTEFIDETKHQVFLAQAEAGSHFEEFGKALVEKYPQLEITRCELGAVIAAHSGPGFLGVAIAPKLVENE